MRLWLLYSTAICYQTFFFAIELTHSKTACRLMYHRPIISVVVTLNEEGQIVMQKIVV